jgi:hypothetical protein
LTAANYSRLAVAALLGTVFANAAFAGKAVDVPRARGNDGIYTVNIVTRQGSCDRYYQWTILVSGGRVSSAGDTPVAALGQINPSGAVRLQFQSLGDVANVTGRVAKGAGSGTWTSPTLQCSGSWRAIRRG